VPQCLHHTSRLQLVPSTWLKGMHGFSICVHLRIECHCHHIDYLHGTSSVEPLNVLGLLVPSKHTVDSAVTVSIFTFVVHVGRF